MYIPTNNAILVCDTCMCCVVCVWNCLGTIEGMMSLEKDVCSHLNMNNINYFELFCRGTVPRWLSVPWACSWERFLCPHRPTERRSKMLKTPVSTRFCPGQQLQQCCQLKYKGNTMLADLQIWEREGKRDLIKLASHSGFTWINNYNNNT